MLKEKSKNRKLPRNGQELSRITLSKDKVIEDMLKEKTRNRKNLFLRKT